MSNKTTTSNKLVVKDLVTIGIFSLLFIVFTFLITCLQVTPLLSFTTPPLAALVVGPIFLLFIARTQKPLCITIMGIIISLLVGFFIYGHVLIALFNFVFFILAELIARTGGYKKLKTNFISYIVLSFWSFGEIGGYWVAQDWMMQKALASNLEADFFTQIYSMANLSTFLIIFASTIICAILSCLLAKAMFKKHFIKSGIA